MLKPAVFFDRDGVINVDKGYVYRIGDFEWIKGSKECIKYLNENNYHVFIITNQSGIARSLYTENDVIKLHNYINLELNKLKAKVDEFFMSPYHPDIPEKYQDLIDLRKPNIGMLKLAESKWEINKAKSFLVGDKITDIECATNYGIKGHLFKGGDLLQFVKKLEIV